MNSLDLAQLRAQTFLAHAEHYASLPSTQDRARTAAGEAGAQLPLLIVADEQTHGRGRGANRWWTGQGSLAFSLVIDPASYGVRQSDSRWMSLSAALAVIDAVSARLPGRRLGLHWPNDVFVEDGKLAGILVEVLGEGRQAIGVGLNVNNTATAAPADLNKNVATLFDLTGRATDPTELLVDLLRQFEAVLREMALAPERLGERFNQLCMQTGKFLSVEQGSEAVRGVCAGIAADGALLLDTPSGLTRVYSGVVVDETAHR